MLSFNEYCTLMTTLKQTFAETSLPAQAATLAA